MAIPFKHVSILGVGLIGGSMGLALRRHVPDLSITGLDDPATLDAAHARGAIERRAAAVPEAVSGADLVILAAPIATNLSLLRAAAPHLKPDAVVTDVGSVKRPIESYARERLTGGPLFIGGHPMAGSEKRGVAHADPLLFENAVYAVCPPEEDDPRFTALTDLLARIGARVLPVSAQEHDDAAAVISHLPQLLSVALVNQLRRDGKAENRVLTQLAAGGFRDMTRIAGSPFAMWRDILAANNGPVLDALGRFATEVQRMRNRLAEDDLSAIGALFEQASDIRSTVPAGSKGFLRPLSDVFVYTPDEPGALQRITASLATDGVNIKDMELLKIREGTGGTFRLGFASDAEADAAIVSLQTAGFQAYRL